MYPGAGLLHPLSISADGDTWEIHRGHSFQPVSNQWRNPMTDEINHDRRRFFGAAALTLAAAGLAGATGALTGPAKAATLPTVKPGANTSFAALKQVKADVLDIGYAEAGPAD